MTSQLIRLDPSDLPSSPNKGQSGVLQVTDNSATRIPSSCITGRHQQPTGSPIGGGGSYHSTEVQSAYSDSSSQQGTIQVDMLAVYMFIFGLHYVLNSSTMSQESLK